MYRLTVRDKDILGVRRAEPIAKDTYMWVEPEEVDLVGKTFLCKCGKRLKAIRRV